MPDESGRKRTGFSHSPQLAPNGSFDELIGESARLAFQLPVPSAAHTSRILLKRVWTLCGML